MRILLIAVLLMGLAGGTAQAARKTADPEVKEKLEAIEKKLAEIEGGQAAILANQEKIFEDLKNLRYRVRRS